MKALADRPVAFKRLSNPARLSAGGRHEIGGGRFVRAPADACTFGIEVSFEVVIATMQHHNAAPDEIDGRLYVGTGRERALSTAIQTRDGIQIIKPEMEALAQQIAAHGIDLLVIDPFVSSHQVSENDNGAIDFVAKEWARLAEYCNCAIELVHHTRKTNGEEAATESAQGATALLGAARSGRVLNKMRDDLKLEAGV